MQQTETYNLNIIETNDTFSPDALNKNAEALEAQLARIDDTAAAETVRVNAAAAAETTRVNAAIARIDAALERLDAAAATIPKFACGSYSGNSTLGRKITLSFTPKLVFVATAATAMPICIATATNFTAGWR